MADPTEERPTPKRPLVEPTLDNPDGDRGIERFDEDPMVTLINGRPPTPFPTGDGPEQEQSDEPTEGGATPS